MNALTEHLKRIAEFTGQMRNKSLEAFVFEHGKPYEAKALPEGFEYGVAKECYKNAFHAVLGQHDRYAYCEGYAFTPGLIPVEHAWVVDREDGKAIEVTWRDGGKECGFCLGEGVTTIDDEDSLDYGDEVTCDWCHGKGEQDHEHPKREGTQYYGVELDYDWVVHALMDQGYYGVLPRYANEQEEEAA